MSEACDLDASVARRLIGRRQLSPVELLDSCIARIEAVNPATNAIVATCLDRARDEARAAEQAVMRGEPLGPLHGLPIGIKDLNETEGLRTTFGSLLFEDHVPAKDERVVAVLRAAGGIVLGKTNTPEFGAGGQTVNPVYGATGNPFDPTRSAGGSSGGSAAALALGMVPLAGGSDTGGSLRTPAAWCGTAAFRTSPGVVPSERRGIGWTVFSIQGPMARTLEDCGLMLSAMAGSDGFDPLSSPLDPAGFRTLPEVDLADLRVAVSADLGFARISETIRATFGERVGRLRPLFGSVDDAAPDLGEADRCFWILRGVLFLAGFLAHYEKAPDKLGPNVRGNVEAGLAMTAAEIAWAQAEQTRIYRRVDAFFDDHDLLIAPACSIPPFGLDRLYPDAIDGRPLVSYMDWLAPTYGLTLAATPVALLPCGLDATGTPFGLQITGRRGRDREVLAAALALEQALAGEPDLARPRPDLAALTGRTMVQPKIPSVTA